MKTALQKLIEYHNNLPEYEKSSEGFEFSTKNVHFVIASNIKFPTEDEAARKQQTSPGQAAEKLVSKAAIGDRMNTYHIDFNNWMEQWGFVANEILQNPNLDNGEFSHHFIASSICSLVTIETEIKF
jgi:hypothetical protein